MVISSNKLTSHMASALNGANESFASWSIPSSPKSRTSESCSTSRISAAIERDENRESSS